MNFAMTRINHQPFIIWLNNQCFKQAFPNTPISPATKTTMCIFPVAIVRWQITPGCACSEYPKNGIDKQSIVTSRTPNTPFAPREKGLQNLPGAISNIMPSMELHSPSRLLLKRQYYIIYNLTILSRIFFDF